MHAVLSETRPILGLHPGMTSRGYRFFCYYYCHFVTEKILYNLRITQKSMVVYNNNNNNVCVNNTKKQKRLKRHLMAKMVFWGD